VQLARPILWPIPGTDARRVADAWRWRSSDCGTLSKSEIGLSKREISVVRRWQTCSPFDVPPLRHVRGGHRFALARHRAKLLGRPE